MMVIFRQSDDPEIEAPLGQKGRMRTRAGRFAAKRLAAAFSRGGLGMQSLGLLPSGLGAAINRSDADIVHLHWVGGEALSIGEIGAIRKPLVWTLHDLWALRGVDHYGDGEAQNAEGIEGWTWRRKQRLWNSLSVSVVSPSRWLAAEAHCSAPFRIERLRIIPNALDPASFQPHDRKVARAALGLPESASILLFGAQDATTDPRKGFELLKHALHALQSHAASSNLVLAVFGGSDCGQVAGFPTYWLGRLTREADVARACSAADAFVAPSRADNLPNTVLEALFCGLPCVAFDVGGMPDMIEPGETGFLAKPFEPEALAKAIKSALAMPEARRARIREWTLARFDPAAVVERHATLYRQVLSDPDARAEA